MDPAYLPLQHQLFGEQHGLVAERFRHLHSYRRIPGTARTFDTCGRQGRKSAVSAVAANRDRGGGVKSSNSRAPACVRRRQKGRSQNCLAGTFHKSSSASVCACVRVYNWHHSEGTWRDTEKEPKLSTLWDFCGKLVPKSF